MTTNIPFDFTVDKPAKTVVLKAEFDAEPSLVWDAFTKKEILDQWWAPLPFTSKTKAFDFKVGGRRFYAMISPEGVERWQLQKYTSITPKTNFKYFSAFADKDENPDLPGSDWDFDFKGQAGKTTVTISIKNESLERMERMMAMGFHQGIEMTLNQMNVLLKTL